jgi:hypothetical protein
MEVRSARGDTLGTFTDYLDLVIQGRAAGPVAEGDKPASGERLNFS